MLQQSPARRKTLLASLLLAFAVVSPLQAAEPAVLQQVPADAYGVVVVNNVRTLANKVSNAAARLQMPTPPDLVGTATRAMGIDEGFDANSSIALVFLKPADDKADLSYFNGIPPAVLLLPTTNSKAMLENYKPTEPDKDGIIQVTLPQSPDEKGFVAVVANKWVAYAQKREYLAAYLARTNSFAKTASPETLKVFDLNDIVTWGNVEKLGAGATKFMDDAHTAATGMQQLRAFNGQGDPFAGAVQKLTTDLIFNFGKQVFSDTKAGMITARITDSGTTLGLVGEFKPDTPIGKFVASQAGRGPLTLKGLPDGKFIMAATGHWNSASIADLIASVGDSFLADPVIAKSDKLPEMRKTLDAAKQMAGIMQGMNMILMEPSPGSKDGLFLGAALVETSDPKKFMDLQVENFKSSLMTTGVGDDIKSTVSLTPNAQTIKGIALTKMSVGFALRDDGKPIAPENRLAFEMLQRIYGPNGLTAHMGVVGKRVLAIYGTDPTVIESAVTAAQADSDALTNNAVISSVKDDVVANPIAVAYLPIDRWVNLAQTMMAPGAAPAPNAANVAPVVLSAGVTGKMFTAEIHVPTATITAVQEGYARLNRAMQGGGPPVLP